METSNNHFITEYNKIVKQSNTESNLQWKKTGDLFVKFSLYNTKIRTTTSSNSSSK